MNKEWTDEELEASVDAYADFLRRESGGQTFEKLESYRNLAARFGRTKKAFEYRMQNISAVLDELGERWVKGLKPAANVGSNVKERLTALLVSKGLVSPQQVFDKVPYQDKLPAIREWLIRIALQKSKVCYGDVMEAFGIDRFSLRHGMDRLGHEAKDRKEPIITALIVNKSTKRCSDGLAKEFGIYDDQAERENLYHFWASRANGPKLVLPVLPILPAKPNLVVRAAKFASIEVRPKQAAFRRRLFLAYGGRCAVSGCDIDEALDAAHKHGRDWRMGHNDADDGYLLRKDLHALYDSNLLTIGENGAITFADSTIPHYQHLVGAQCSGT